MFIDIHAHAYRKPIPFGCLFSTVEQLIQRWDNEGIEKGCVLPIVNPEIYIPQANEDILDMAEAYPDRIIPFCNVDPRALTNSADAPLERILGYYRDKGCKGLGEVMPNMAVNHPMVQNLFKCAEAVGLPVTTDGSDQIGNDFGLYDDPGLPQLEHTLQKFPNLKFLGHGPLFWSEIARLETPGERNFVYGPRHGQVGRLPQGPIKEEGVVPKLMRIYPNLYGDLSDFTPANALKRDPEYGPKFVEEFQDRLLFGTDICSPDMVFPMIPILLDYRESGKISEVAFQKVARLNAIKMFELE